MNSYWNMLTECANEVFSFILHLIVTYTIENVKIKFKLMGVQSLKPSKNNSTQNMIINSVMQAWVFQ